MRIALHGQGIDVSHFRAPRLIRSAARAKRGAGIGAADGAARALPDRDPPDCHCGDGAGIMQR